MKRICLSACQGGIKAVAKLNEPKRCFWCNIKNEAYIKYHDEEWGRPCHDDRLLYELLILECFQAGLSWECVLNKRGNFRRTFDGFDVCRVAQYDPQKLEELRGDSGIIRNRLKLDASVTNSVVFRKIQHEYGSFDKYIWGFTNGNIIFESCDEISSSPLSDLISKDLKKRGMRFVGTTIVYSYLQAIGIINGHTSECFLFHAN